VCRLFILFLLGGWGGLEAEADAVGNGRFGAAGKEIEETVVDLAKAIPASGGNG
jgi:hypothetical protein